MESATMFRLAADIILLTHASFVLFVVVGLILIFVGKVCGWAWIRHFWLRIAHLLAIGVVMVQSWFGVICPLTTLEMALRAKAGEATYAGAFISHWLETLLYYQAPAWAFAVCYTIFGALVVGSWFWVPPQRSYLKPR
jgi:hypothetical protein